MLTTYSLRRHLVGKINGHDLDGHIQARYRDGRICETLRTEIDNNSFSGCGFIALLLLFSCVQFFCDSMDFVAHQAPCHGVSQARME